MKDRLDEISKAVINYYSQLSIKELTESDFNLWIV